MIEINFFDEVIQISKPESLDELILTIQREYAIENEEINGLILLFENEENQSFILNKDNFKEFIELDNPKLIVEVEEKSKMYLIAKENEQRKETEQRKSLVLSKIVEEQKKKIREGKEKEKRKKNNKKFSTSLNELKTNVEKEQKHKEAKKKEKKEKKENAIDKEIDNKISNHCEKYIKDIIQGINMEASKASFISNSGMFTNSENKRKEQTNRSLCFTEHKVKCCECGKNPIKGFLFKCPICIEIQMCKECEIKFGRKHKHPLLKLRFPVIIIH